MNKYAIYDVTNGNKHIGFHTCNFFGVDQLKDFIGKFELIDCRIRLLSLGHVSAKFEVSSISGHRIINAVMLSE